MKFITKLRTAMFLVLIHSFIPMLILAAIFTQRERVFLQARINDTFDYILATTEARIANQIFEAKTLVQAIAQTGYARTLSNAGCAETLRRIGKDNPSYTNLVIFNLQGNVVCSIVPEPPSGPVNVADREYFQEAIKTKDFTMSPYVTGRFTGEPVIISAYPIVTENEVIGVAVAGLSMNWMGEVLAEVIVPENSSLMVLDHENNVLARYPEVDGYVGKNLSDNEIVKNIHSQGLRRSEHTSNGIDGVNRLYKHTHIAAADDHLHLYIGFPTSYIKDIIDKVLLQNTVLVFITTLIIIAIVVIDWRIILTIKRLSSKAS